MNEGNDRGLEEGLAALSRWEGEAPGQWRKALDASGLVRRDRFSLRRLLARPVPRVAAALVAMGTVVAVGFVAMWPTGGGAGPEDRNELRPVATPYGRTPPGPRGEAPLATVGGRGGAAYAPALSVSAADGSPEVDPGGYNGFPAPSQALPVADRQVARKATVELATGDVRAAFLKAAQLVSVARGEFVESSSLTGEGTGATAELTMRVAAERLSDVLNDLRALGDVRSEKSDGEDVTTQAVDLEARLSNERQVERELLELMERRPEDPLKDILAMRQQLAVVRQSIEVLEASRTRLARLVELATVLVIIRHEEPPPEKKDAGLGRYFSERIAQSWFGGLRFLTDSVAWTLRVLVGGLAWWLALVGAVLVLRHWRRQLLAERAVKSA